MKLAATALFALAALQTAASAQDANPKAVVELFTSQGCSSCPAADAVLSKLIERGDILALSYHVDYWNYLGWKDTFSSKESTQRQYDYAKTLHRRNVYTPQAVINGRDHVVGSDKSGIDRTVRSLDANGKGLTVPVNAAFSGDRLKVGIGKGRGHAEILLVTFDESNTVSVRRGENAGRALTYRHSVREVDVVGMWDGEAMEIELPETVAKGSANMGCAVLLQSYNGKIPGAILGAGFVRASPAG